MMTGKIISGKFKVQGRIHCVQNFLSAGMRNSNEKF